MKITAKHLRTVGIATALATVIGVTGCRSSSESERTTSQAINDKMITFDVKRALDQDRVLKYPDIKVSVFNRNAQLSGFVNTEEQRQRAAEIAAGVKGVSQVINEIMIKPLPTGRAPIRDTSPP